MQVKENVLLKNYNIGKAINRNNIFQWLFFFYLFWTFKNTPPYPIFILTGGCVILVYLQFIKKTQNQKLFPVFFFMVFTYLSVQGNELKFEKNEDLIIFLVLTFTLAIHLYHTERLIILSIKMQLLKYLFSVIIAFCFFGYRLLIEDKTNCSQRLVCIYVFIFCIFWAEFFLECSYRSFRYLRSHYIDKDMKQSISEKKLCIILFIIFSITGIFMSIIFYPGMISYEGVSFFEDATHFYDPSYRTDIRSFAYTLFWVLYYKITSNCYFATLLLVFLMSGILTSAFLFLYKNGLSYKLIIFTAILWTIQPVNMYMTITLFKDNPYTIFVLLSTYLLIRLIFGEKQCNANKWIYVIWFISLIFMALLRTNGIAALLMTVIASIVAGLKKQFRFKTVIVPILATIFILLFKGPFFEVMNVQSTSPNFSAVPFLDGIWECIYQEKQLPDDIKEYMFSIIPEEDYKEKYVETYMNYYFWPDQYLNENISLSKSVKAYGWCLKNYPLTLLRARFKKTSNIWSVFPAHKDTEYLQRIFVDKVVDNDAGWEYKNSFQTMRDIFNEYYKNKNIIHSCMAFFYRGGWNLVLILTSIWYLIIERKTKLIVALAPILGSTIALLVACCFGDYRYVWPLFVSAVVFACSSVTFTSDHVSVNKGFKT